ncbi:MAG: TIGR03936 family radical SAM-associated protein [Pirellulaceae bacterium]
MEKTRLRIRFTKQGDLRWISHRDLARVWERLLRRANLKMAFSQGFHPKPRISFPSALALGVEALEEIVELEILGSFDLTQIEENIREQLPEGMKLIALDSPNYGLGKAKVSGTTYRIQIPDAKKAGLQTRIDDLLQQESVTVSREKRDVSVLTEDPFFEVRLEDFYLFFSIPHDPSGALRPSELLGQLGLEELLTDGEVLQRVRVHMREPEPKTTTVEAEPSEPKAAQSSS